MASKKPAQTVRQRSQTKIQPKKSRRLRGSVQSAGRPLGRLLSPLAFLQKPFQTRPMRFIGRVLGKVLFINYFVSSWHELRQVTWPTKRETVRLTVAVFIFSIVFGILIALTDYGLDKVFKKILLH